MGFMNLRDFLTHLDSIEGEIEYIRESLSTRYEIPALLGYNQKDGPAIMVENVEGFPDWRIVGNVLGSRHRVAMAFGVPLAEVDKEYLRRKELGVPPVEVNDSLVKEVVITQDIDLTRILPVLTFHEKDAGPYITTGICIAHHKSSGNWHVGVHRMQVKGPNRLGIFLANPYLGAYFTEAEAAGKPLDIAIAIGVDPMFMLAAVTRGGKGIDKMSLAGGLRQQAVPLVRGETISTMFPAMAEIVLEGRMLPGVREVEGPFGESSGYYSSFEMPVIEVTAVNHRASPLYQTIVPFGPESDNIMRLTPTGTDIRTQLARVVEGFIDFAFLQGTYCFQAVISLKKTDKGQVRKAALHALTLDARIKQVTVVDDDVDINIAEDVAWAIATRAKMDEDVIIIPDMPTYPIDPGFPDGPSARMIIDATRPAGTGTRYTRISHGTAAMEKAAMIWKKRRYN